MRAHVLANRETKAQLAFFDERTLKRELITVTLRVRTLVSHCGCDLWEEQCHCVWSLNGPIDFFIWFQPRITNIAYFIPKPYQTVLSFSEHKKDILKKVGTAQ